MFSPAKIHPHYGEVPVVTFSLVSLLRDAGREVPPRSVVSLAPGTVRGRRLQLLQPRAACGLAAAAAGVRLAAAHTFPSRRPCGRSPLCVQCRALAFSGIVHSDNSMLPQSSFLQVPESGDSCQE